MPNNDTARVQHAADIAARVGGTIADHLPPGTYRIDESITVGRGCAPRNRDTSQ